MSDERLQAARAAIIASLGGTVTQDGFVTRRGNVRSWRRDTTVHDHAGWTAGHVASVSSRRRAHIIKYGFETLCGCTASMRADGDAHPCPACTRLAAT